MVMITIVLPVWFTWVLVGCCILSAVNGVLYLVIKWLEYRLKK